MCFSLDFRRTLQLQGLQLKEVEDSLRACARQLKMKQEVTFHQDNQLIHKERPQYECQVGVPQKAVMGI